MVRKRKQYTPESHQVAKGSQATTTRTATKNVS